MRLASVWAFATMLCGAAVVAPTLGYAAVYTEVGSLSGSTTDGNIQLSPPNVLAEDIFQVGVNCKDNGGSLCNNALGAGNGWQSFVSFKTGAALDTLSNTIAAEKTSGLDTLSAMTLSLFQGTVDAGILLSSTAASVVNNQLVAQLSYANLSANTDFYFKIVSKVTGALTSSGWAGNVTFSAVPLPAAAWLFGSAFLGLCWLGRRSAMSGVGMLPR